MGTHRARRLRHGFGRRRALGEVPPDVFTKQGPQVVGACPGQGFRLGNLGRFLGGGRNVC